MRALLALALALPAPARAGVTRVVDPQSGKVLGQAADNVVLVRFKPGSDRGAVYARSGGAEREPLEAGDGWFAVDLPAGMTVTEALRRYRLQDAVAHVQPNYIVRPLGVQPTDALFAGQYGLQKISAPAAWETERGLNQKVTIAVLDTGIDEDHPDLTDKLDKTNWAVRCPLVASGCAGSCSPCTGAACTTQIADAVGHGTQVAGVAGAETDNVEGVAGTSWGATILPIRVFDSLGCADSTSLSNALSYVRSVAGSLGGPLIINMSVGEESTSCLGGTDAVNVQANAAYNEGHVLIAAAGNFDPSDPGAYTDVQCPGRIPVVVAVGATDSQDDIADFSARGSGLDMVAPGVQVLTTGNGGIYITNDGTSFSSPMTAGVAALMRAARPAATPAEVVSWLTGGVDDIGKTADLQGQGRLNAYRSLRLATRGTLAGSAGETKAIAFPNPWRGQGTVAFSVPASVQGGSVEIKVFQADGLLVRTLDAPVWDGKNGAGYPVASGVYVFQVKSEKGSATGRVAVLR